MAASLNAHHVAVIKYEAFLPLKMLFSNPAPVTTVHDDFANWRTWASSIVQSHTWL